MMELCTPPAPGGTPATSPSPSLHCQLQQARDVSALLCGLSEWTSGWRALLPPHALAVLESQGVAQQWSWVPGPPRAQARGARAAGVQATACGEGLTPPTPQPGSVALDASSLQQLKTKPNKDPQPRGARPAAARLALSCVEQVELRCQQAQHRGRETGLGTSHGTRSRGARREQGNPRPTPRSNATRVRAGWSAMELGASARFFCESLNHSKIKRYLTEKRGKGKEREKR